MLMLGISTSGREPSVEISRDDVSVNFFINASRASYSETLMELIELAVNDAGIELSELDAIAVDIGPGSFTGVRIGVCAANAMASALGIPVIPVSSLAALRHLENEEGAVCAMIDCRNGNCYAALYVDGEETVAPCAAVIEEFKSRLPEGTRFVGDCMGHSDIPDAELVLNEAFINGRPVNEAVPMYLRPSQAERMKAARD